MLNNEHIADLLMGAALADSHLDGREFAAVKRLLAAAMPHWEQAQSRIHHGLGPARWIGLLDDLAATVTAVRGR